MDKLNPLKLRWPTNWAELFGNNHPLILEIGFGRGQFLFHLAQTYPDHNIIGLEISNQCLVKAENRIERERRTNVRTLHAMAETALHHLFAPASLAQVHINFPDPWFKERHSHRRLMQRDTLDAIVNRLAPGGLFYLATDIVEYAEMSAELLAETPELDNLLPTRWTHEIAGRVVTKYEATAEREGRERYFFAYQRNTLPPPAVYPVKEMDMPHLLMENPLGLDDFLARFEPHEVAQDDVIASYITCYRGQFSLLFDVYVKEPTIDQRVGLLLRQRKSGDYTLILGAIGQPRPTPGIHMAVAHLGAWLISLHPDARLIASKLQTDE
jgi:tRNA (guanine-N7-)-methyltransferase